MQRYAKVATLLLFVTNGTILGRMDGAARAEPNKFGFCRVVTDKDEVNGQSTCVLSVLPV